ncbi:MAG: hypothetical protein ABII72_02790 [Parcubacteria group bacterium]
MKMLFKLSVAILIFTSVAILTTNYVFAAIADSIQPATTITYNERLIVNNTAQFDSIYVGKQGVGGVTFFNGTIINNTTDDDSNNLPITFGDDVRIDGELYRTEAGGENPLKIADSLRPQTDNTYDLGAADFTFKNAYFSGTVTTAALTGSGIISSDNILDGTIATVDLADSIITSAKILNRTITGSDINTSANLNINTLTTTGNISTSGTVDGVDVSTISSTYLPLAGGALTGDVDQNIAADGIVKSSLIYNPIADSITKSMGLAATATQNGTGDYSFEFSQSVNDRFFQITPSASNNVNCVGYVDLGGDATGKTLRVKCYTASSDAAAQSYVVVSIF